MVTYKCKKCNYVEIIGLEVSVRVGGGKRSGRKCPNCGDVMEEEK